jgi:hypothetical protein
VLPKRAETVTALASRPEHAGEHYEQPNQVPNTAHTKILGEAGAGQGSSEPSMKRLPALLLPDRLLETQLGTP